MVSLLVQNAPMTEQQQAAIVALSHAVAERPFPAKLVSTAHANDTIYVELCIYWNLITNGSYSLRIIYLGIMGCLYQPSTAIWKNLVI